MDGLWGAIIAIVAVIVFGKFRQQTTGTSNVEVIQNANPTPDGIPAMTTQNNDNPPTEQPSPWSHICPQSTSLPMSPAQAIPFRSNVSSPVSRVTFSAT